MYIDSCHRTRFSPTQVVFHLLLCEVISKLSSSSVSEKVGEYVLINPCSFCYLLKLCMKSGIGNCLKWLPERTEKRGIRLVDEWVGFFPLSKIRSRIYKSDCSSFRFLRGYGYYCPVFIEC